MERRAEKAFASMLASVSNAAAASLSAEVLIRSSTDPWARPSSSAACVSANETTDGTTAEAKWRMRVGRRPCRPITIERAARSADPAPAAAVDQIDRAIRGA